VVLVVVCVVCLWISPGSLGSFGTRFLVIIHPNLRFREILSVGQILLKNNFSLEVKFPVSQLRVRKTLVARKKD
jgi:hypothetical protein